MTAIKNRVERFAEAMFCPDSVGECCLECTPCWAKAEDRLTDEQLSMARRELAEIAISVMEDDS